MIWPQVLGQERAKHQLVELIGAGRLAHAYLFRGDEGWGKDAMALQLARAIHCERGEGEVCGECPDCIQAATLQHPDIHFVMALPIGKGEGKGADPMEHLSGEQVESIREELRKKAADPYYRISIPKATVIKVNSIRALRREASLSTSGSRRRIVIISRAEEMNEQSSNALLKTLEEPHADTMFILTSAHPEQLLATVRSRCHHIKLDPLTAEEIRQGLSQRGYAEGNVAELAAHLANGSFTRATELLHEDIARERTQGVEFIRSAVGGHFARVMEQIEGLVELKDRDTVVRFLNLLALWFRDAMVLKEGRPVVNIDQMTDLESFLKKFPKTNLGAVLDRVESAVSLVARNGYIPLVMVRLSIELRTMILHPEKANALEPSVLH